MAGLTSRTCVAATYLEGELQLRAGDDNVGEIQQVDLQRVQHTLAVHNDALGLLLHWQGPDQSSHLWYILTVSTANAACHMCTWMS